MTLTALVRQLHIWRAELRKAASTAVAAETAALTQAGELVAQACAILERLTEAKRWFGEVPGSNQQIWDFFIGADHLKSVLDADPIFQPLLASGVSNKG